MARETAKIAEAISGDGLYQERARRAFPLLVRQAECGTPINYSDLAQELKMPNPRNLNFPLGSIGHTLTNLSKAWKTRIPPLQCLVVNKNTGLPGEGIAWFLRDWGDFASLPKRRKKEIVIGAHAMIYAYPDWNKVLDFLDLTPITADFSEVLSQASDPALCRGESDRHRALKKFVARNPMLIGLPKKTPVGFEEFSLPSGDCLDVSFDLGTEWVAAEVKTRFSNIADIVRGLYQCVKYRAVMEAVQAANGYSRSARSILIIENVLTPELIELRNTLGVEVREGFCSWDS